MEKSCANHPESMALATCKACDKSVCLMCVVDEKEGTFCSADCHTAFANGQEVPKFVGAAAESGGSGGGVQKIDSIFDDDSAPAPSSGGLNVPPSDDRMPIVAEGTKWRPIGAQCENHADTPAVANCDRCGKPVCALCLLEAAQGTFCSSECMSGSGAPAAVEAPQQKNRPAPTYSAAAERAALQGKPVFKFKEPPRSNRTLITVAVVVLLVAGAAGAYYGWNAFTPDIPPGPRPPEYVTNTTDTTTKPEVTKPEVTKPEVCPT
ncbi:MAG: hypothetical protein HY293_05920 [Planctomycetes bacterium]|nr:hypothetical protein [Planctomycetota bacterium]